MNRRIISAALTFALLAGSVAAQEMRRYTVERQTHGETQLRVTLELAAGGLRLAPRPDDQLYRMELLYDSRRFVPRSDYDAATGHVTLGLRSIGSGGLRVSSAKQLEQTTAVWLNPGRDLALTAELDAVNAQLELGGLRLAALALKNGGSRTVARFSTPNRIRCGQADLRTGAAEFKVLGLGNSRCNIVRFYGGVGAVTLDFSGEWTNDMRLEATMAAGTLQLRLPRGLGVKLTSDNFLSLVAQPGMAKQDDAWLSEGYQDAARHLDIHLKTSLGGVSIEWLD